MDLPILIGLGYLAFLAYTGIKGGTGALQAHLFLVWFVLIVLAVFFQLRSCAHFY